MPTYEYRCKVCGAECEIFQRMSDAPETHCGACGDAQGLERLMSAGAGLIFKGSGFYITDYRKKDYHESASKDKASVSSSSSSKSTGSGSNGAKKDAKPKASTGSGDASSSKTAKTSSSAGGGD